MFAVFADWPLSVKVSPQKNFANSEQTDDILQGTWPTVILYCRMHGSWWIPGSLWHGFFKETSIPDTLICIVSAYHCFHWKNIIFLQTTIHAWSTAGVHSSSESPCTNIYPAKIIAQIFHYTFALGKRKLVPMREIASLIFNVSPLCVTGTNPDIQCSLNKHLSYMYILED